MNTRKLGIFSLIMMTIVSVDSVRNLPATALFSSHLLFFYGVAAVFFLLPSAFVSAELASGWPEQGGIYVWVREAFGPTAGLWAIWLQWVENVIWYPTILSSVAGTFAYMIDPQLGTHPGFLSATILVLFWAITLINLFGLEASAWFSNVCSIFGLILPMLLIIGLGLFWACQGHALHISFAPSALLPDLQHPQTWVALTGIVLSCCGIELATVHAREVRDPQNTFPKVLIYSAAIILSTLVLGGLAIAIVLPAEKISLVTGMMQAFDQLLAVYHLNQYLPVAALMLIIGGVGGVNNWVIAPLKGLSIALKARRLPAQITRENVYGAPKNLLLYQAVLVSIFAIVFLCFPSVNASYWFLTVLAAQLYMVMYLLMFIAACVLRVRYPNQPRLYRIPGGARAGMFGVSTLGILGSLTTLLVGFIPPSGIEIGHPSYYIMALLIGLLLLTLPPWLIARLAPAVPGQ